MRSKQNCSFSPARQKKIQVFCVQTFKNFQISHVSAAGLLPTPHRQKNSIPVFLAFSPLSSQQIFASAASLLLPHTRDQFVLPTGIHIFLISGTASSRNLFLHSPAPRRHLSSVCPSTYAPQTTSAESADPTTAEL